MAYQSLFEFVKDIEKKGELVRIKEKVSPILEITEITDRVSKSKDGGKALLFENVEGSSMPVLINAFGSWRRMSMSLGVNNIEEVARRMADVIMMKQPRDIFDRIDLFRNFINLKGVPPKIIKEKDGVPPCQQVVYTGDDIDLFKLPALKCWPQDGGRFITMPVVFTKSLETGKRNAGMYRLQIYDKKTTGMHWHIHKDGSHFFQEYRKKNRRMEVAVAIGTDPAVTYAATAPMPRNIDEMLLAGFIRKKRVELVKCKTVKLEVPRTAEIVLEGYVEPDESRLEGPFGDHTGYYSLEDYYPVFHLTAITMKRNPIYLTTIVGKPPMEDCYMAKATERIFMPLLKTQVPELVDMCLPWEGVFHNCVVASIDKLYPLQARKVMSSMWGLGQMSFAKMIAIVDPQVKLSHMGQVLAVILNEIDLTKNIVITEGILDVLDHSSPTALYGGKVGIDATTKIEGEPGFSQQKEVVTLEQDSEELLSEIQKEINEITSLSIPFKTSRNLLAIVGYKKTTPGQVSDIISALLTIKALKNIRIFLIIDDIYDVSDYSVAAWKFFNNCDPRRDFYLHNERLFLDATKKYKGEGHDRKWPDDIDMTPEIKTSVVKKWPKLGIKL